MSTTTLERTRTRARLQRVRGRRRRRGVPHRHRLRRLLRPRQRARPRGGCTSSRAGPPARPRAVMFFALEPRAASARRARRVGAAGAQALLPGPAHAAAREPRRALRRRLPERPATLGLRVPRLPERSPRSARVDAAGDAVEREPLGRAGRAHARRRCPSSLRDGADLVLDGGELPGHAVDRRSTCATTTRAALARAARGRAAARAPCSEMLAPRLARVRARPARPTSRASRGSC